MTDDKEIRNEVVDAIFKKLTPEDVQALLDEIGRRAADAAEQKTDDDK